MGRKKNSKQQVSVTANNDNFENADSNMSVDHAPVEESSNLYDSMVEIQDCLPLNDDRTSADYYFDSYSHFGL